MFDTHHAEEIYNIQKRQKKYCTKNNCLKCCRLFTTFMFSRVGFLIIMIGYLFAGRRFYISFKFQNNFFN